MPTLPSQPAEPESHQHRRLAESFGSDPARYDRSRPSYPEALVRAIVAASPGPEVLDVGCGTGISSRLFQAAGCRVLGVDVDARMAEFARRHGVDVQVGRFESWEPGDRVFDTVIAGQTWHWVDPVAGAAKAAGVLRPGGRLAVFWNAFLPPAEVAQAFGEVYRRVLPGSLGARAYTPSGSAPYGPLCDKAAEGIRQAGAFAEPEQWRFDWERTYTRDEWLDQVPTGGEAGQYSPAKLAELLTGLGAAIDAMGGSFVMPYAAVVVTAARTA